MPTPRSTASPATSPAPRACARSRLCSAAMPNTRNLALWNEVGALFAPAGTFTFDGQVMPAQTAKGPAAIAAFLRARYGGGKEGLSADGLSSMFIENPLVNLSPDGNSAKARWDAMIFHGHDGKARIEGGIFENDYALDRRRLEDRGGALLSAVRRALRGGMDQLGRRRPADRSPSFRHRHVRHPHPTRDRHRAADQGDARRAPEACRRAQRRGPHPQSPGGLRLL